MTRFMWCSTRRTVSFRSSRRRRMNVGELVDLLVVQAARRLVEQQQPRLRDERARELDALERPEREARGRTARDVGDPDVLERLVRAGAHAALALEARHRVGADEDVLEHGHRREELDVLERAGDAEPHDAARRRVQQRLAVEDDVAGVERGRGA